MIHILLGLILLFMIFTPGMPPLADTMQQEPSADSMDEAVKAEVLEAYGKLPVLFIQNDGQLDSTVEYYVKASRQTLYFTGDSIIFDLIRYQGTEETDLADRKAERLVFSIGFLGASERSLIEAGDKDKAIVNYFIGNAPERWYTDIPTYKQLVYGEIYPGIDLRLYGKGGMLEYEFVVKPGASVADIALACTGVEGLAIAGGELVVGTAFGDMKQTKPYIYQQIGDEEVAVDGGFRLVGGSTYGFEAAAYDAGYPLIIDPSLAYSTYLGGSSWDEGCGIAVDASGCAYITGATNSDNNTTFPLKDAYQGAFGGGWDAFVTGFTADGSSLMYSTYLGGGGYDVGYGIAVDASGCAYITGYTDSNTTFPLKDAYQGAFGGGTEDAFVTGFTADGSGLMYSTYLGGGGHDVGYGIAVDASGCAYVTGYTNSNTTFPLKNAYQVAHGGGVYDAFVTGFTADGSSLMYSTYLGGGGFDAGYGIAVDASGCAYITGDTSSNTTFPLKDAYQGAYGGGVYDAFVTGFTADGSGLMYSTYLGGSNNDEGWGIAVDASGCAYITGYTDSDNTNFPLKNAYQGAHGGGTDDAFVTRFTADGSDLMYSTYLGGNNHDYGKSIAVDAWGCAYVTGYTSSNTTFPLKDAHQGAYGGGVYDAFVTKLGDPYITVTPASIDFGSVLVGSSSPQQTITVTNDVAATADLVISAIDTGGADAGQFSKQNDNVSGQTISPGGSATLEVAFNPTSIGTKTAALSIPSNDPDDATVNVALSGTGIQQTQTVATATGAVTFTTDSGDITGLTAIAQAGLACPPRSGLTFPHGFFSFNITNITPGSTVTITITLPSAMAVGTQYWKCQNGQWVNCTSLLGDDDGDNVLTLTITDGGLGDADGVNGTIVDPGGPAVAVAAAPAAPGASYGADKTPPYLKTKYLNVNPQQVYAGQTVTISTNVVNHGGEAGSYTVALKINGQVEQTRTVTVSPGVAQPVRFTVSKTRPGTYTVAVSGGRGQFTVIAASNGWSIAMDNGPVVAVATLVFVILLGLLVIAARRRSQSH